MRHVAITLLFAATALQGAEDREFGRAMLSSTGSSKTIPTSVVALIGNPRFWQGKAVSVEGYMRYDLHGTLLFMSTEHCLAWHEQYAVQILTVEVEGLESELLRERDSCMEATVEGTFEANTIADPKPNTIVIRERPGIINTKYVRLSVRDLGKDGV